MSLKSSILVTLFFSVGLGIVAGLIVSLSSGLPQVEQLSRLRTTEPIEIYGMSGQPLTPDVAGGARHRAIRELPTPLIHAFLAAEDRRFYDHVGVDLWGVVRAVIQNLRSGRVVQGGSTITQQVAKVLFLTHDRSLRRKIREALLALEIERRFTKDEILEIYLNSIYFGRGAVGVAQASWIYFGRTPDRLNWLEFAFLASLPKAPHVFSQERNLERVQRRIEYVLSKAIEEGWASAIDVEQAREQGLRFKRQSELDQSFGYLNDMIFGSLAASLSDAEIARGGLSVHTTVDPHLQRMAAREAEAMSARYNDGREIAIVVLDTESGAIRALIGGVHYERSPFNRAVKAVRQIGSTVKPFYYGYAIDRGMSPLDTVWDNPEIFRWTGGRWAPQNFDLRFDGRMTIRESLRRSKNLASIDLLRRMGISEVRSFLSSVFPADRIPNDLTLALGTVESSLLTVTNAYRVFGNRGVMTEPHWLSRIDRERGDSVVIHRDQPKRVLSPQAAAMVRDLMESSVREPGGTGWRAKELGGPVALKTGTTNEFRDGYALGLAGKYTIGAWVGFDDNRSLGDGQTGSQAAVPIWMGIVRAGGIDLAPFPNPVGVLDIASACGEPSALVRANDPHLLRCLNSEIVEVPSRSSSERVWVY